MVAEHVAAPGWHQVSAASDHALAGLARREVGQSVRLIVETGPRGRTGALRFQLFLRSREVGLTTEPFIAGSVDLDPLPGTPWIEVTRYRSRLPLANGEQVEIPEGIGLQVLEALAGLLPEGGSLIVEYDSPAFAITAEALAAGVPPAATPLGGMLFVAGCGSAIRHAATTSRSGRRALQGFRFAPETTREQGRGLAMLAELERFLSSSSELDWQVQSQTRPIAEATITALRARHAVPEGPLPPP